MIYKDLLQWFTDWFQTMPEGKIKLYLDNYARINDVEETVTTLIVLIESTPQNKRKIGSPARANKNQLIKIKAAIEAGTFENESFVPVKFKILKK